MDEPLTAEREPVSRLFSRVLYPRAGSDDKTRAAIGLILSPNCARLKNS
ncbi:hypothetical protein [Nitrobacter sp.]